MKARLIGNHIYTRSVQGGFSTIELVISLALLSLVLGGIVLANWSSQYWIIASQTSSEGLSIAKETLEEMRIYAGENFFSVQSLSAQKNIDQSCSNGGLCYYVEKTVADISPCAKFAETEVSWRVQRYPTTTASLFTYLSNPKEILAIGADCVLNTFKGSWASISMRESHTLSDVPTHIDVLSGTAYTTLSQSPYLSIVSQNAAVAFTNNFALMNPANAIDVARRENGRTYAYLAMASTSNQFQIVDVTQPETPVLVAKLSIPVSSSGSFPQGWRIQYYDAMVYITARETAGPEFHVFDVNDPERPIYVASKELNTSVYGLGVRTEGPVDSLRTLAYLATTATRELMVLDVTDPMRMFELTGAATDLSGDHNARSIFLSGNVLYIGCASAAGGDFYALDSNSVLTATHGLAAARTPIDIGSDVTSIQVVDTVIFLGTSKSAKQLQVFLQDGSTFRFLSSVSVPGLGSAGLDIEEQIVYVLSSANPHLRMFESI